MYGMDYGKFCLVIYIDRKLVTFLGQLSGKKVTYWAVKKPPSTGNGEKY